MIRIIAAIGNTIATIMPIILDTLEDSLLSDSAAVSSEEPFEELSSF